MNTKISYYTDTPQDTAFTDKLLEMARDFVNLAGLVKGEFTVIDILPDDQIRPGGHIYGPMQFKFLFSESLNRCIIYPARFDDIADAQTECKEHGTCTAFKQWSTSNATTR